MSQTLNPPKQTVAEILAARNQRRQTLDDSPGIIHLPPGEQRMEDMVNEVALVLRGEQAALDDAMTRHFNRLMAATR